MIAALTLLLLCQLGGEIIVRLLALPLPGPVAGLILLATGLAIFGRVPENLRSVSTGILRNLALMFVPASVGIITQMDRLQAYGVVLAVSVVVSTLAAMAVTALVFRWATLRITRPENPEGPAS
ncbi:CidA/LrgA family protein [Breoghania sp.]|uniref:CidA/LrgA family protein n=1 Tax=Breoghania sp. TaxID=2065378 RepID=UPI002AAAF76F|nr:CidA/LrgA family protein [Breoghania sp.]